MDIRQNLHLVFDGMIKQLDVMKSIKVSTGVDINNNRQLRKAACKIAGKSDYRYICESLLSEQAQPPNRKTS